MIEPHRNVNMKILEKSLAARVIYHSSEPNLIHNAFLILNTERHTNSILPLPTMNPIKKVRLY